MLRIPSCRNFHKKKKKIQIEIFKISYRFFRFFIRKSNIEITLTSILNLIS